MTWPDQLRHKEANSSKAMLGPDHSSAGIEENIGMGVGGPYLGDALECHRPNGHINV